MNRSETPTLRIGTRSSINVARSDAQNLFAAVSVQSGPTEMSAIVRFRGQSGRDVLVLSFCFAACTEEQRMSALWC